MGEFHRTARSTAMVIQRVVWKAEDKTVRYRRRFGASDFVVVGVVVVVVVVVVVGVVVVVNRGWVWVGLIVTIEFYPISTH